MIDQTRAIEPSRHRKTRRVAGVIVLAALGLVVYQLFFRDTEQLHRAAQAGDAVVVQALLQRGHDPNAAIVGHGRKVPGVTPLMLAASSGSEESVRHLIDAGAQINAVNEVGMSPLIYAIDHPGVVRLLLQHGADPTVVAGNGDSPVSRAARTGEMESLELLLDAGARVEGNSLFAVRDAAWSRCVDCLRALLDRADSSRPEFRDVLSAALIVAAGRDCIECVEELVARGADVNAVDHYGATPLMRAAESASPSMIQLLLEAGADASLRNESGLAAIDFAEPRDDETQAMIDELLGED